MSSQSRYWLLQADLKRSIDFIGIVRNKLFLSRFSIFEEFRCSAIRHLSRDIHHETPHTCDRLPAASRRCGTGFPGTRLRARGGAIDHGLARLSAGASGIPEAVQGAVFAALCAAAGGHSAQEVAASRAALVTCKVRRHGDGSPPPRPVLERTTCSRKAARRLLSRSFGKSLP